MPSSSIVRTRCECQASLGAELDARRQVIRGWAVDARGREEVAPAQSLRADRPRFEVAWACPCCTRNTLRSFDAAALGLG